MSWQLWLIYGGIGASLGVLATLDELPRLLALVIFVVGERMGATWMEEIAPHWHSTWWQPGLVMLAAACGVTLMVFHIRQRAGVV